MKCTSIGSRTIAPEENFLPTLKLILTLIKTLTLTGGQFSSGAIFRIPKVYILWEFIRYTINWDKISILFILRAPTYHILTTHHILTFNWRYLYELKHKILLSKIVCWVIHLRVRFVFIRVYIFAQQEAWSPWI